MQILNSRSCTLGARHILCTAQGPTSRSVVGGVGRHASHALRHGPRPVSGRRVPGVVSVSELQAPSSSPTPVTVKLDNDTDPNYTIISVRNLSNFTAFLNEQGSLCASHIDIPTPDDLKHALAPVSSQIDADSKPGTLSSITVRSTSKQRSSMCALIVAQTMAQCSTEHYLGTRR